MSNNNTPEHIWKDVEQAESADRWNDGVPFKSRWERKLYEGGFSAGWDAARAFISGAPDAANAGEPARMRIAKLRAALTAIWMGIPDDAKAEALRAVNADDALATPTGVAADESTRAPDGVALPKALAWKLMGLLSQELAVCADPDCRISSNPEADVTECREALYAALKASGERPSAPAPDHPTNACRECGRGEVIDGRCDRCGAPAPEGERNA